MTIGKGSLMAVEFNKSQTKQLQKLLKDTPKEIPKRTATIINDTTKKHKTAVSKKLREYVMISAKGAKSAISVGSKAKAPYKLSSSFHIKATRRPSLKNYKAKQTKAGVTYQIDPKKKSFIAGAFGPKIVKLNKNVFLRKNPYSKGGDRTANRMLGSSLKGPNMWKVYTKHKLHSWSQKEIRKELEFQFDKQIRYVLEGKSSRGK
tara:strand:- start:6821 stop:7435 length:615 start_codon:yes stop_codon:yes gene_type:complete